MRLSEEQRGVIRDEVRRIFGGDAVVRLFGSRVDDHARGGDIDLHIEATGQAGELLDCELRLRACLARRLGDRRVDVVVHSPGQAMRPIDERAHRTGVRL